MKALIALLFATIIALLAIRNLPWHLDDKDQAKQAFTSFEMSERGHWWFQHTPTGKVATKPPLAGWISAALSPLGWETAWRLPGFACALVTLGLLWRTGNQLGAAPLGGILAIAAFGLNHFSQRLATLVRTDMLLAFFIFLGGYLVHEHVRRAQPWSTRDRWLLFLAILASMLTKGPIAYAFLLPGVLAFWSLRHRAKADDFAWPGWWPWFAPLLVFGAWAGIGIWQSPEFYKQVVEIEFLGRFTVGEASVHHNQPVWFYLAKVLLMFAPWSVLLLALHFRKDVRAALAKDPARLWLVCWAIGGLVFMSLVPSKRADRIFPVIPPLCLLLASTLAPLADLRIWGTTARRIAIGTTALACLITVVAATYEITDGYRNHQGDLVRFGKDARRFAAANPERLEVVSGKDEGLLLYTGKTGFTKPQVALARWRAAEIDWLVMSDKEFAKRGHDFAPCRKIAEVPQLQEKGSGYILLSRGETPPNSK